MNVAGQFYRRTVTRQTQKERMIPGIAHHPFDSERQSRRSMAAGQRPYFVWRQRRDRRRSRRPRVLAMLSEIAPVTKHAAAMIRNNFGEFFKVQSFSILGAHSARAQNH